MSKLLNADKWNWQVKKKKNANGKWKMQGHKVCVHQSKEEPVLVE